MRKLGPPKPIKLQSLEEKWFGAARQFERAAVVLHAGNLRMPAFVYSALTFELYLKCLIAIEQKKTPPRTHDLYRLFQMTSVESQRFVRRRYKAVLRTEEHRRHREVVEKEAKLSIDWGFDNILKSSRNAFLFIRYYFEEPERVFWFAGVISGVTLERIYDLRPDFKIET